ncbi:uncharacterized protein LOC128434844 [Pleuronectes platessa]|uniref:uncharacterized protein LOC128434844 n=1 Tax=Pleuronectes platessa TaxID=8262 RepID=UPI00232A5DA8|nr:uncharacterized protein LOC128434844 [Pleuronectes platessa]XP_053273875.1 uncharacterized protein LOC128434844 [Pleuronectes platessa]XP_053273876.1 uncharacterized protein LOC128434844 [Pleuronectes platessa]
MYQHNYCLAKEKPKEPDPSLMKKEKREEARLNRLKRLQKSRITLGVAYPKWKSLLRDKCFKSHADVAFFLLDSYERDVAPLTPMSERPVQVPAPALCGLGASSWTYRGEHLNVKAEATGAQSLEQSDCDSIDYKHQLMNSPHEAEWGTLAAPSIQSSENGKEQETEDAACEGRDSRDELTENGDLEEDEDEEFSTSLSVGDGRYLVDLGSPSELIVDEACILQLFRSCRECSRQCKVTKYAKGLKIIVFQECRFCQSSFEWTNLPDEDEKHDDDDDDDDEDDDSKDHSNWPINGNDTAHQQANTAPSPRRCCV